MTATIYLNLFQLITLLTSSLRYDPGLSCFIHSLQLFSPRIYNLRCIYTFLWGIREYSQELFLYGKKKTGISRGRNWNAIKLQHRLPPTSLRCKETGKDLQLFQFEAMGLVICTPTIPPSSLVIGFMEIPRKNSITLGKAAIKSRDQFLKRNMLWIINSWKPWK